MIGSRLAHYEILEELGHGGMGVVYKARDTHLDRFVAIKVLPAEAVVNPERKRRFVQEAKAASSLNHPNIVTIYDIASEAGVDYIVMEYVAGKTLEELTPRQGMRSDDVLEYAVQIAGALVAAHGAGIVHRDMKPGNIMVSEDRLVKLLDFGLAKLTEMGPTGPEGPTQTIRAPSSGPHTQEGTILGTVSYMSPEQAEGRKVDARSDIFAFGSVLYEMVTGRRAFLGDSSMSTLAAIIHKEPAPLSSEIPRDLGKVISRCLRKDPARRIQHMDDVQLVLEDFGEQFVSDSQTADGSSDRRAIAPWNRRIAAAALVFFVVATIAVWRVVRSDPRFAERAGPPVVVLMDTPAPEGVYDDDTRRKGGTNADDLSQVLRDLPVLLHKETVSSSWDREDQILKQHPDLILIHLSSFAHSMRLDFGMVRNREDEFVRDQRSRLQGLGENKLAAFIGHLGLGDSVTRVLIYTRDWVEEDERRAWITALEQRFPYLGGRVYPMHVPGGDEHATFRDPATAQAVRRQVISILGLDMAEQD